MARPTKWRKVDFIPTIQHFVPYDIKAGTFEENILQIEEVEAIRLKDLEGLEQEECAQRMEISRQTFQRILINARLKLTDSIINGKGIRIEGGNYTRNICPVHCLDCGSEWKENYESFEKIMKGEFSCPSCDSERVSCERGSGKGFCRRGCWRRGQEETT